MLPAPRGLPPLVPPLVPAEPKPEPAESELAVAVDPRVGGTVGRLLPIARAEEAGSGAGPRRDDVAVYCQYIEVVHTHQQYALAWGLLNYYAFSTQETSRI